VIITTARAFAYVFEMVETITTKTFPDLPRLWRGIAFRTTNEH
jgi:hypothetical protein